MSFLNQMIIDEVDKDACHEAVKRWNAIAKPIHSLGLLEDAIVQIAGITRSADNIKLDKAALVIMCGDHGVVKEGVTQTGQDVTRIVADNFTTGNTSAAVMAKTIGVDLYPIDLGIAVDGDSLMNETKTLTCSRLTNRKIRKGTGNIAIEPAMQKKECMKAIETGIDIVRELKQAGYELIATGEMGIGNTTPSSALASVLLKKDVTMLTGRGAGLSDEGLLKKIKAIRQAIQRYEKKIDQAEFKMIQENIDNTMTVIELMSEMGGLEIAGMMGVFLGGAIYHIPILIDGFISAVAALCAVTMESRVEDYVLASHVSKEPAGELLLEKLHKKPLITAQMCLGEGTGAIALIPLLRMALAVYQSMSTFKENDIEEYVPYEEMKC